MMSLMNTFTLDHCRDQIKSFFKCRCPDHWQDFLCQTKVNYCHNITCKNQGCCRPNVGNWTCECPGNNYYGRYCEYPVRKILIHRIIAKTFAYIAIIAMVMVALFVLTMDILKYVCGIDPVAEDREKLRQGKLKEKPQRVTSASKQPRRVQFVV